MGGGGGAEQRALGVALCLASLTGITGEWGGEGAVLGAKGCVCGLGGGG